MDLNFVNMFYRKSYSGFRKDSLKPKSHIDDVSTYFVEIDNKIINEYKSYTYGLSKEKTGELIRKIHDNLPTDNVRIVISHDKEIDIIIASIADDKNVLMNGIIKWFSEENERDEHRKAFMFSVLNYLSGVLSQDNTYLGEQFIEFKNKRTGKIDTNKVIYISKEKSPKYISPLSGNKIDWKHSWMVSGHWRKVRGIGKDRYGDRVVFGKTWVIPSIKGNGALVEKIRVVR